MASFKKTYDKKKREEALGLLRAFAERIKAGEFIVETAGHWPGVEGTHTLRISVKESENNKRISNL
jgi:hypothetical protein